MKLIDLISNCLRAAIGGLLPSSSPSPSHWTGDSVWFGELQTLADDTARQFANPDHYALNFDDLRSEVLTRLTKCRKLDGFYSSQRKNEFFRYAKTVANNRARTLVIQHMATRKRAGDFRTDGKPVYVSMDDPDHHVPQEVHNQGQPNEPDWISDIHTLTIMEKLVLHSLLSPSPAALVLAQHLNRGVDRNRNVEVRYEHHALALGLSLSEFTRILEGTKPKIMAYKTATEDTVRNRAVAALEEAFNIYVPKSLDLPVLRRLMTIAARDNYTAVTETVKGHLATLGAKVPEMSGGTLRCYGVLYSARERTCSACGLRVACATEAKNFGLGDFHLAPSLLGEGAPRIPTIMSRPDAELPAFASGRDELLWAWLSENLEPFKIRGSFWFRAETSGGVRVDGVNGLLFEVNTQGHVRFCVPTESVKALLVRRDDNYYLSDSATIDGALSIFNAHVSSVYAKSES